MRALGTLAKTAATARRRPAKVLYLLASLGVCFGFIAAVVSIAQASWFWLPAGVDDQGYVTVVRRTADGPHPLSIADVERITALAPEVSWFHVRQQSVDVRDASGTVHALYAHIVPEGFFENLGVEPGQGSLAPAVAGAPAVVASDALWQRLYSGDDIADAILDVHDGPSLTIAGVAPPAFTGVLRTRADLWIQNPPSGLTPQHFMSSSLEMGEEIHRELQRRMPTVALFGVVPHQATFDTVVAKTRNILADYRFDTEPITISQPVSLPGGADSPGTTTVTTNIVFAVGVDEADRLELVAGLETEPDVRRDVVQKTMWLLAIVVLLLAMVFVSVVEFLMAENVSREDEHRVRIAVGAGPVDVFRRAFVENAAWVGAIALVGWLGYGYAMDVLLGVEPFSNYLREAPGAARLAGLGVAAVLLVVAFVASMAYVSGFVSRSSLALARSGRWLRRMTRQVLLFVGTASLLAVLSLASRYLGDARLSLGFANTDVSMVMATVDHINVMESGRKLTAVAQAIEAIPGVRSTASARFEPLTETGGMLYSRRNVADRPHLEGQPFYENGVTPGFFSTLGVDLIAGRVFDAEARNEVLVSRAAAQSLGGIDAVLGAPLVTESRRGDRSETTVVGVVADIPYDGYASLGTRMLYAPVGDFQMPEKWLVDAEPGVDVAESLRQLPEFAGWEIDDLGTPASVFREQFLARRSVEIVLSVAAAFALVLALAGVANSLARGIAEARSRIGVRFALGATPRDLALAQMVSTMRDLAVAGVAVAAAALTAKLAAPAFAALLELWLLVPALACVFAVCALLSHVQIGQLARRNPVDALLRGLGGEARTEPTGA